MNFTYSEEAEAFRREFRTWLEANRPPSRKHNGADARPAELMGGDDENHRFHVQWHKKMNAGGWVGIGWPKEYGGRGATLEQQIVYNEELLRANAPGLVNVLGLMLVGPTLMHWGTDEQKLRYLPRMLSADEIWCQGYSEPNAGSDVAGLQTRAIEQGDDFIVNGQKVWTSDAHRADWCILLVRTDPEAPKHLGISYLLVDMKSPGITVRPLVQITGDSGFNEVFFEDVRVPKKNLVGAKNQGWQVAVTTLMFERTGISTGRDMVGAVDELAHLVKSLTRDGRAGIDDSTVRQKMAGFLCDAMALRYSNLRQLTRRLKGLPPGPEGSVTKLTTSELNLRMVKFAMEVLGPYSQLEHGGAFTPEGGKWPYKMLASRALTIAGGTSEIQHNIVGERVLKLPKG